jgi:hypothetical protein
MPNAPERPVSFPEWRRIRKIKMIDSQTWTTSRKIFIGAEF